MSSSHASSDPKEMSMFQRFVHWEVAGSVVLLAATVVALGWANSTWHESYFDLVHKYVGVSWGDASFEMSLQHWVNDLLMVIFFFVVGLEIKRELVLGHLSTMKKAALPVMAAVGGMVVPALIYAALNAGGEGARGWGIPMATDIAFALGILAVFGSRVPIALKVFLTALAIADDLGAVLVIALFYTEKINLVALIASAVFLVLIGLANRAGVRRFGVYVWLVLGVWLAIFASGVHATVAGILVAMMVPLRPRLEPGAFFELLSDRMAEWKASGQKITADSVILDESHYEAIAELDHKTAELRPAGLAFEHYLHQPQAFYVLPLFAFFNAGVRIGGDALGSLANPISIGIILGLVVGKQIGVTVFSWLAVRLGWASLPEGVNWLQIWGLSCLAGVGFTMSLFVSELAFYGSELVDEAKLGILTASLVAGVLGALVISRNLPREGAGEG
jgi:NhaA family Na+:H+ antiporter